MVHLEVRSFPVARPFQVAYSYLEVYFEEDYLVSLVAASCPVEAYLVDLPFLEDLLGDHLEDRNLGEPYLAHLAASQADLYRPLVAYQAGLYHPSAAYQEDLFHLLEAYQEVDLILAVLPYLAVAYQVAYQVASQVDLYYPLGAYLAVLSCPVVACLVILPCPVVAYLVILPCPVLPCLVVALPCLVVALPCLVVALPYLEEVGLSLMEGFLLIKVG